MIGGLSKSTSLLALLAATGVVIGGMAVPSAKAADLGGDCCADLEERVAELEATTARKGNRKMSLTVYGHVNRSIMYFNDGKRSNTFVGMDNHNSATRFGFMGNAKISPTLSAGYSILLDWGDKSRTSGVTQTNEEGGTRGNPNVSRNEDGQPRLRDVNVWIEHKAAGRLTLGRITNSGQNGLIDLGGTTPGLGSDPACTGGALKFRKVTGALGASISDLSFGCGGPIGIRMEGLKWTSPTVMGFILDASVGETLKVETSTVDDPAGQLTNLGRVMGVNLKYAGEYGGVRIAAGVGAEWSKADEDGSKGYVGDQSVVPLGGVKPSGLGDTGFGILPTNAAASNAYVAGALSLMHVPSGLFAQGHYTALTVEQQIAAGGTKGDFRDGKDASRWDLQAGISKNWFGIGNTVVYGEYGVHKNFKFSGANDVCTSVSGATPVVTCATSAANGQLKGDELRFFGIGLVQNVDAAAMELYIDWRRYSAKDPGNAAVVGAIPGEIPTPVTVQAAGAAVKLDDLDIITAGARIKF
jgi:Gram-negative porin